MQASRERVTTRRRVAAFAVVMLLASGAALAAAPALMPASYSWMRQMISETAAQGVGGAWLARVGFLLSAAGVLAVATLGWSVWAPFTRAMHAGYGLLVVVLAVFSRRPWMGGSFDAVEDLVHTTLAPIAGGVFVVAVLALAVAHRPRARLVRMVDVGTIVAVAVLALVMVNAVAVAGLAQRAMALIGITWYAVEAIRAADPSPTARPQLRGAAVTDVR